MPRGPADRRAIARGRVPSPPDDGPGFVAAPARARTRKALRDIGAAADRHLGGTGVTTVRRLGPLDAVGIVSFESRAARCLGIISFVSRAA